MARLEEAYHYMFSIIRLLADSEEPLGVLDLAFRLDTRPETIRRHLETMQKYGIAEFERVPGKKSRIRLTELGMCIARCLAAFSSRKD